MISAAGGVSVQRGDHGEWRDDPSWFQLGEQGTIRYGVKVLGKINDAPGKSQGYKVQIGLSWELLGAEPAIPRASSLIRCRRSGWRWPAIPRGKRNPSPAGRRDWTRRIWTSRRNGARCSSRKVRSRWPARATGHRHHAADSTPPLMASSKSRTGSLPASRFFTSAGAT